MYLECPSDVFIPIVLPSISYLKIEQKTAFQMYFKCFLNVVQMTFKYSF